MSIALSDKIGLIATKLGMTRIFVNDASVPVTLLHVKKNVVVNHKRSETDGYSAAVVAYLAQGNKKVKKPLQYINDKLDGGSLELLKEFRVSSDAHLPEIGSETPISYFPEKSLVKVTGRSIGKGFAGCVKKYGFATLDKSNISRTHRAIGSTGQRNEPGKVFKGKKMPGHMGASKVTMKNIEIIEIDQNMGIIAVKGSIPGHKGTNVLIQHC